MIAARREREDKDVTERLAGDQQGVSRVIKDLGPTTSDSGRVWNTYGHVGNSVLDRISFGARCKSPTTSIGKLSDGRWGREAVGECEKPG